MAQFKCGVCGKEMFIPAEELAGRIICTACGATTGVESAEAETSRLPLSTDASAMPDSALRTAPAQPGPSRPLVLICIAAVVVMLVLLPIGIGIGRAKKPPAAAPTTAPAVELAAKVAALKSEAEVLAIGGELESAHAKYREIEQLVGGRNIKETELRNLVERAKQGQDDIYRLLLLGEERQRLADLYELKAEAEQLAITGDLAGSHAVYRELDRLIAVAPLGVRFPANLIDRIRFDQDRVFGLLMQQQQRRLEAAKLAAAAAIIRPEIGEAATRPAIVPSTLPATRPALPIVISPLTRPTTAPARTPVRLPSPPDVYTPVPFERTSADRQIDDAIRRASEHLLSQFKGDQIAMDRKPNETYAEGLNALCVYALLRAGQVTHDERLRPTHPVMKGVLVPAIPMPPMQPADKMTPYGHQYLSVYVRNTRSTPADETGQRVIIRR